MPEAPQTPPRNQSSTTTTQEIITPSTKLDYKQINIELNKIAVDLEKELSDSSKIYDQSTKDIWKVNHKKTFSKTGSPNFYLNITCNGWDMAHLSIHMGRSLTKAGSTHIKYYDGITNQLLFNGRILISSKFHRHPFLEDCILI